MPIKCEKQPDGTYTLSGLNDIHLQVVFHPCNITTFSNALPVAHRDAALEIFEATARAYGGAELNTKFVQAMIVCADYNKGSAKHE